MSTDTPSELLHSPLHDAHVAELLDQLPEDERSAVRARIVQERSYTEIATALRCSQMVARKRVSRGLARMRARLQARS